MKKLLRSRKALSPVIATVILVSVTIVVAVSVAYWMGTLASSYTAFEQIQLPTAYAEYTGDLNTSDPVNASGWKIYVDLKNTGSADATIDNIFLNEKPVKDYASGSISLFFTDETNLVQDLGQINIPITKGASEKIIIWIEEGNVEGCTHGTRIDLKFHSAAGLDYSATVKLI